MKLYFIKTNKPDGVYGIADFYVGSTVKQVESKSLSLNFKANDGMTSIVTPSDKLPDDTLIRDYTHLYAKDAEKIYKITSSEYVSDKQLRLMLEEDAFIANYKNLLTENLLITRSNDSNLFKGLHDISDISTEYTSVIKVPNDVKTGQLSGNWLIVMLQPLNSAQEAECTGYRLNLNIGDSYDSFDSITVKDYEELIDAYPTVQGDTPWYYGKKARTENGLSYYYTIVNESPMIYDWVEENPIYTRKTTGFIQLQRTKIFYPGESSTLQAGTYFYMASELAPQGQYYKVPTIVLLATPVGGMHDVLTALPASPTQGTYYYVKEGSYLVKYIYSTITPPEYIDISVSGLASISKMYKVNSFPNQPMIMLALPFNENVAMKSPNFLTYVVTASAFRSLSWKKDSEIIPMNIISTKIVSGDILSELYEDQTTLLNINDDRPMTYNVPDGVSLVTTDDWSNLPALVYVALGFIKNQKVISNISYDTPLTSVLDYEPFKKYELHLYGQKFEIPAKYVNSLYLRRNLTQNGLNLSIYLDPEQTQLYLSTLISLDSVWSQDVLANYVASNPTYKDEYNTRRQQEVTSMLVGGLTSTGQGVLAGAMAGGPAGALIGGTIGLASSAINLAVRQEQYKEIFNLSIQAKRLSNDQLYGSTANSDQLTNIRGGLYWVVKTSDRYTDMMYDYYLRGFPTNNVTKINTLTARFGVYGTCKIIQGRLLNIVKNIYTTNAINSILSQGVTIVD